MYNTLRLLSYYSAASQREDDKEERKIADFSQSVQLEVVPLRLSLYSSKEDKYCSVDNYH